MCILVWSRMPSRINVGTEQFPNWKELGNPGHTVNRPMERFRYQAGLCSWTERTETLVVKEGLQKLYGNLIQNNSIKAFGRDLFPKEAKEIKKGKEAVFPINFAHSTRGARKRRSNGAAKPSRIKDDIEVEKVLMKKREPAADDEGQSSKEEAGRPLRSRKIGFQGSEESSIAAEVADLVMSDNDPFIIDLTDGSRRNPIRSSRGGARLSGIVQSIDKLSDGSSANEEYEDVPTEHYSPRRTRRPAATRHSERIEESSGEDWAETEDEDLSDHTSAFERVPRAGDFGGRSKEPSCISSTNNSSQRKELGNRGQSAYYATFKDLSSNEPSNRAGVSDTCLQNESQTREFNDTPLEQNESSSSPSHASEAMMNGPPFEDEDSDESRAALQALRKWLKDFEEDKDGLKRLRTEQTVLPLPAAAQKRRVGNIAPQITSPWPISPQLIPQQVDHPSRDPPAPHARSSETREQQLATESAEILEPPIMAPGSEPVDYSIMPPPNNEEVQNLIDALSPTREMYFAWTGQPAPRTDPQQSYRAQLEIILGAFQDWWGAHRAEEPLPILTGALHWGGSVDDGEPLVEDSIYDEGFGMGNRARCGADGSSMDFLEWTGDMLESALREISGGDDRAG